MYIAHVLIYIRTCARNCRIIHITSYDLRVRELLPLLKHIKPAKLCRIGKKNKVKYLRKLVESVYKNIYKECMTTGIIMMIIIINQISRPKCQDLKYTIVLPLYDLKTSDPTS